MVEIHVTRDPQFRRAVCDHLADRDTFRLGYRRNDLVPEDITDVDVRWSDGGRWDPTYPSENVPPTLDVTVSFRPRPDLHEEHPDRLGTVTKGVETGWAIEQLFRIALGLEFRA